MPSIKRIRCNGDQNAGRSERRDCHFECRLSHTMQTSADTVMPGTEVRVFGHDMRCRPIIEARAHTIENCGIAGLPDLWRVRFLGEDVTRLRLVHGGMWQSHPHLVLRALTQEWRLSLQPELLFENPFPERR